MDESTRQPGTTAGEPAAANRPRPFRQGEEGDPGLADRTPGIAAGRPEPAGKKRSVYLIGGLALLVIVLAAAAYVGGRWLNRGQAGAAAGPGNGRVRIKGESGVTNYFSFEPAKELPQNTPDLQGVQVRRQDNSLFVGTGQVTYTFQKGATGNQVALPNYDGPVLEVVVTHDTQIFRDETGKAAPEGDKIQQVVEPGSLDEIATNSMVSVWGEKTGDRIVARILLYSVPSGKAGG